MVVLAFLTNLAQQLSRKKSKNPKFLVFGKYGRTHFHCHQRSTPTYATLPANLPAYKEHRRPILHRSLWDDDLKPQSERSRPSRSIRM